MPKEKIRLITFMKNEENKFCKDNKKLNKKTPKNQFMGSGSKFPKEYAGVHESLLTELLGGSLPGTFSANVNASTAIHAPFNNDDDGDRKAKKSKNDSFEEENESTVTSKLERARRLFRVLSNQPNITRDDIVAKFENDLGLIHSTAASYYDRISKELGWTEGNKEEENSNSNDQYDELAHGMRNNQINAVDQQPADSELDLKDEVDEPESNRMGVIRTVDNAHLIYKKQTEDGRYDELWIYNTEGRVGDELTIRRAILAGTDIPPKKTASPDGEQRYTLTTLGNAQYLHIMGLVN